MSLEDREGKSSAGLGLVGTDARALQGLAPSRALAPPALPSPAISLQFLSQGMSPA